jgi:hypothetical protein
MKLAAACCLFLLAGLSRAAAQQLYRWPGCYAFSWGDTVGSHQLSVRVRFESQRDTSMHHPPFPLMFLVSAVPALPHTVKQHRLLSQVWWTPVSADSFQYTVVDHDNVEWNIDFARGADSLVGTAMGGDGDATWGPFIVSARRIPCR